MNELEYLKKETYSLICHSSSNTTQNEHSGHIQEQSIETKLEAIKVYALLTIAEKLDVFNITKQNTEIYTEKRGKWAGDRYCTNCNYDCDYIRTPHCPSCGAKMEEWDKI